MGDRPRQEQLDLTTGSPQADGPRVSTEPVQGGLFPDDSVPDELVGYRGPSACQIAGITYRQLDYWARTSLVVPSIRGAAGSGSQRLYSFKDILVLKIVKRLLDTGISLHNIRVAVDHLRQRGVQDLANITLFSDGTTVYECTSAEEVVDLLQGGQGVFGIAVSGAMRELTGAIADFPGERADGGGVDLRARGRARVATQDPGPQDRLTVSAERAASAALFCCLRSAWRWPHRRCRGPGCRCSHRDARPRPRWPSGPAPGLSPRLIRLPGRQAKPEVNRGIVSVM